MRTLPLQEFKNLVGTELGPSDWLLVDQPRIDRFADATEDRQFIHVDPPRAEHTALGGTIAHGFLTLALVTHLQSRYLPAPEGCVMILNYGSDKVRYLQPVPAGSRVRARSVILSIVERDPGQWLVKTAVTVEVKNGERPALYAEILSLAVTGRD
ncbi:MAG: MaoC family dehydratase [Xanthomonadales bacterium]|nr:MaoC family dehydratase [Xanthomonadales bacterium]NIX13774.1 MaoC family dehydratase [Xanthomonadales bacterium]